MVKLKYQKTSESNYFWRAVPFLILALASTSSAHSADKSDLTKVRDTSVCTFALAEDKIAFSESKLSEELVREAMRRGLSPAQCRSILGLNPPEPEPLPPITSVEFKGGNGGMLVNLWINDSVKLDFVIDTGASSVVIPEDVLTVLRRTGTLNDSDFRGTTSSELASGQKIQAKKVIIRELKVGQTIFKNVSALIMPDGPPLLGMSLLSKYNTIEINLSSKMLTLRK